MTKFWTKRVNSLYKLFLLISLCLLFCIVIVWCLTIVVLFHMQTPPDVLAEKDVVVAEILKRFVSFIVKIQKAIEYYLWSRRFWLIKLWPLRFFRSEMKQGEYVFDIPTLANSIGVTTTDLSNQLQNLKVYIFKRRTCFKLFSDWSQKEK